MEDFDRMLLIYSVRIVCFSVFIFSTFTLSLSWKSLVSGALFAGSLYFLRVVKYTPERHKKVKTKDIVSELYPALSEDEQHQQVSDAILKLVSYDVDNTPTLDNFQVVKDNSNCLFAKKAKVWGNPAWNFNMSLDDILLLFHGDDSAEDNIYRLLPMLLKFTIVLSSQKLDAFLMELPGHKYGNSIQEFGDALRQTLTVISDHDPTGRRCMNKSFIGEKGWVFQFNKYTFFITTFAPFYPDSHPRYAFGAENCYILLQPELSFAFHDLPPDTPHTNWSKPVTVRDKIRVAFREAGRGYTIPDTVTAPMAHEILRPIHENDSVYEWWKKS